MPAAGSGGSGSCCCNGCEGRPTLWDTSLSRSSLWRRYCCGCVPSQACVSVTGPSGDSGNAIFSIHCLTSDPPEDQAIYSGPAIGIDGTPIDLTFHFRVVDGQCSLCVESADLGIDSTTAYACIPITSIMRQQNWCHYLLIDHAPTTFIVNGYIIAISAASVEGGVVKPLNYPLHNRQPCYDSYGNLIPDDDSLRDKCCQCSCICRCMCLTISGDGDVYQETACYYRGAWHFYVTGVVVVIEEDTYGGACRLKIVDYGPYTPAAVAAPIAIGGPSNPCPRPSASFMVMIGPTTNIPSNHTIIYDLRCQGCNGCSISLANCCSSGRSEFPTVIYADVETSCYGCPAQTVELAWDATILQYRGRFRFCNGPVLTLATNCPFTSMTLSGAPCTSTADSDPYASCDPILGNFEMTTGGIGCCPGSLSGGMTLRVRLYE